uniref:Uncharacterized protein n=1 Tax=Cannabis sativa TaxID=3483 RepID=A0A803Q858_CANSA
MQAPCRTNATPPKNADAANVYTDRILHERIGEISTDLIHWFTGYNGFASKLLMFYIQLHRLTPISWENMDANIVSPWPKHVVKYFHQKTDGKLVSIDPCLFTYSSFTTVFNFAVFQERDHVEYFRNIPIYYENHPIQQYYFTVTPDIFNYALFFRSLYLRIFGILGIEPPDSYSNVCEGDVFRLAMKFTVKTKGEDHKIVTPKIPPKKWFLMSGQVKARDEEDATEINSEEEEAPDDFKKFVSSIYEVSVFGSYYQ